MLHPKFILECTIALWASFVVSPADALEVTAACCSNEDIQSTVEQVISNGLKAKLVEETLSTQDEETQKLLGLSV
jgi:hypothetical protein